MWPAGSPSTTVCASTCSFSAWCQMAKKQPKKQQPKETVRGDGKKDARRKAAARNAVVPAFSVAQRRGGMGAMMKGGSALTLMAMVSRASVVDASVVNASAVDVCDCSADWTCADVAVEWLLKYPMLRPKDVINPEKEWCVLHYESRGCGERNLQKHIKKRKVRTTPSRIPWLNCDSNPALLSAGHMLCVRPRTP